MSKPRLKVFLYLLLRDHLTFGVVEKIMEQVETTQEGCLEGWKIQFSEGKQAEYAQALVERLTQDC